MNRPNFGHLHCHTAYSLLDSIIRINAAVDKAANDGQSFLAITDHGNLAGAPKFTEACKKRDIKPLIGMEAYVSPDTRHRKHYPRIEVGRDEKNKPILKDSLAYTHLILLAKDDKGWDNLRTLSSLSYLEGFYKRPRIDHELLFRYSEGLIATTACMGGDISVHLTRGLSDEEMEGKVEYDPGLAAMKMMLYKSWFGDDFYIELQDHGPHSTQAAINDWYRERYPSEMIFASADCHYLNAEDADTHDTALCCQTHKQKDDPKRWRFPTDQCWLKTTDEMLERFSFEELDNCGKIADKITFELPLGKQWFMPELPVDILRDKPPAEIFRKKCVSGLESRIPADSLSDDVWSVYFQRLEYEMGVFISAGFVEYALILWDLMDWCKRNDIMTGDGRGSGCGSLVLYSLGITNVDPILRDCPFERFINPGRLENFAPPDVDLDFPQSKRKDILAYIRARYGENQVCQIGTYANLGAAGVVKKLGPPLGIPPFQINALTAIIPQGDSATGQGSGAASDASDERSLSLDQVYERSEAFRKAVWHLDGIYGRGDQGTGVWLMHYARGLRGLGDHSSTHASGVLITDRPVADLIPMMIGTGKKKDLVLAQFDMFDVEKMGIIKHDVLGIATLDALAYTERMVQENIDASFSFNNIDLDDPKSYDLLCSGKTVGIFQAEGGGLGRLIPQTKPRNIEELAILNSLCRPGPMGHPEGTAKYIMRKQGKEPVTYLFPELEPILRNSLGVLCFQEQIMSIAHQLAGYTLSEADDLRKIMGKKQVAKLPYHHDKFVNGLVNITNVALDKAETLWEILLPMAGYAFNKSHSVGYSYTTSKCAFAKSHYPAYFLAGTMTAELSKSGGGASLPELIRDAQLANCIISPPDINQSSRGYTAPTSSRILLGLESVKGCGPNSSQVIVEERETNGPYLSYADFDSRLTGRSADSRVKRVLYEAGCFDALEGRVREITPERSQEEFELFGFYLSSHLCAQRRDEWENVHGDVKTIRNVQNDWAKEPGIRYYGNQQKRVMMFPEKTVIAVVTKVDRKRAKKPPYNIFWMIGLEDETGSMGTVLFAGMMEHFGEEVVKQIKKGAILKVRGRKSERHEGDFDLTDALEIL